MWGLYADYSRDAVGHMFNVADIIVQGHVSNVKLCIPVLLVTLLIAVHS